MEIIRRPWLTRAQWWEFGQDTRVTPLLFTRSAMGFLMTTESQDPIDLASHQKEGAVDSIVSCHYTGALGPTQTTGWAPPAGLTNTSSSSNLVFPGGLPSRYWPAQPCLVSVGNQSWATGWYGCRLGRDPDPKSGGIYECRQIFMIYSVLFVSNDKVFNVFNDVKIFSISFFRTLYNLCICRMLRQQYYHNVSNLILVAKMLIDCGSLTHEVWITLSLLHS